MIDDRHQPWDSAWLPAYHRSMSDRTSGARYSEPIDMVVNPSIFFFMDHTKFLGTEVLNKGCKLWTMNGICMFRPQRPWNYLSIEQFFPTCRMPPPSRAPLSPSWDKLNHPSQIYTPFRVSLMLVYTTGSCWSRGWNAERWTWVRTIAFKLKETKKARELILSLTLSWFYALNFPRLSLTM